eukprot:5666202-Pyramimonas_sp.AAC.1
MVALAHVSMAASLREGVPAAKKAKQPPPSAVAMGNGQWAMDNRLGEKHYMVAILEAALERAAYALRWTQRNSLPTRTIFVHNLLLV